MDVVADAWAWAESTFGTVDLGDSRRTRRLVVSAAQIAAHPALSFTQVFNWNELRGFYRVCHQATATLEAVQRPHWEQTRQAMGRQRLVLILHDTSELDFSSHRRLTGVGQIGNERGKGFLQHNSLAVVPKPHQVLGLAYQQLRVRQPAPPGERPDQRKQRSRESDLWYEGFRASGRPPANCCWVDVADRASDDYEAMRAAREVEHHFLVRANQNRLVGTSPTLDQQVSLLDYARALPSQGRDVVDIPGRGGRPPRTAAVSLAAAAVWVAAPAGTPRRLSQPVLPVWVIRIWEPEPPAGIADPLEWILLCSVPTTTLEEIKERRDWYCCRWLVGVFQDIGKKGWGEEDRGLETADRLETCLAVLSLVAVRVFQLRCALEVQPDAPAEQAGTPTEIRLIRRFLKQGRKRLTVHDFVRGVAKLGGFLGRRHDGTPGVRALWRGYQRLQDMVLGAQLEASPLTNSS